MFEIIDRIKNTKQFITASGTTAENITLYQKRLCADKIAPMPMSYARFLEKANGIYGIGIALFGINTVEPFEDIYEKNTIAGAKADNIIFLGSSLTEYLCYDWYRKSYIAIDKKTSSINYGYSLLEETLFSFLQDYL